MIELVASNLNNGFLIIKNHVLYLHLFDVVLEEHVLDELLLSLVLLAKLLLGCLAQDPLAPKFTNNGDGTYKVAPVDFSMQGYWEISVTVNSKSDRAMFPLCVE